MGDAFIGKVDDSMSVFYNPAGLGSVRNAHFHLANLYFEFNRGWTKPSFGGRLTDVASSVAKAFSLDGIRELMVENKGNFSHQRFSLAPNLSMRFFSLGYFYTKQQRAYLGTGAGDQFEFADRTDQGPYIAFNYSLFGGVVKIGFTGMYLMRSELVDQVDPATTIDLESDDYNSGWLNYTIAGIKLTLPIVGLPTFAVTAHNALDEEFRGVKTGKTLSPIKKNIVAGFSISPKLGRALVMHLEANYKDASNEFPDIESSRKVAFGIEFEWRRLMYWRVGYGDGFGSGGIGLRTKRFEFDLTSYAYDRSASGFRGEEDRRFAVSVSSGL
ncbi:MAG: hypothetical protein CME61_05285 [Halobacteriovoraceae bacterium]|nr:hypothetical protein [Halobacteriovoraceae bacterium]